MGQHIVPRHLLRRISPDGINIWQYDKEAVAAAPKRLPIVQVSQTSKFFDDDIERLLSTIEGAANPILNKLVHGQTIDSIERRIIAVYMEMYKVRDRGKRKEMKKIVSGGRDATEKFMEDIMEPMRGTNLYAKYTGQKSDHIEYLQFHQDKVLSGTWAPSNLIRLMLFLMTWRVLESDGVDFVIGEPPWTLPATVTERGVPKEEVFFPLSSKHVLHLSWIGNPSKIERQRISRADARQINKFFISASDRFVFFNKNCSKMNQLVKNKHMHNKQIEWRWPILGSNPYRLLRRFTAGEIDKSERYICMHPAASEFRHAWCEAENPLVVAGGGKVAKWCKNCGVLELEYDADMEPEIRNSEIALATGKGGTYRNWWMKLSKHSRQT